MAAMVSSTATCRQAIPVAAGTIVLPATAASLVFPFAPHLGCEVYERLTGTRVWEEPWPVADPAIESPQHPSGAVVTDNEMHEPVFPNGTAICEVEIDPDTGALDLTRYASIDDVGRCINPLIVDGQTHGAIAQGVGQALWEQFYVEPDTGQPLTGSFMDYGMPRADTLPSFRTEIAEVLSPTNPLGIKAGGEGGTTAAPAVVVSAVLDALRPLGVRDIAMPVTPYAIWSAIQKATTKRS